MLLEVSLETLKKIGITANQYLLGMLIHKELYGQLQEYYNNTNVQDDIIRDLNKLKELGYLTWSGELSKDFQNVKITPSYIVAFSVGDVFTELYNAYPTKVIRPNGKEYLLRTEKSQAKMLYTFIAGGNRSKHEHIMRCLQAEVEHRRNTNTMMYMKSLYNWLSNREWKSFEDKLDELSRVRKGVSSYGTELQ